MKNRARSWVAVGVILVVYSVIAFAPPFVKNTFAILSGIRSMIIFARVLLGSQA